MNADRVVMITGATGGLGTFVTRHFASNGTRLALIGTNQDRLGQLVGELDLPGERVMSCAVDLIQPDSALEALRAIDTKFGRVDILVHLVGGWMGGKPLAEVTGNEVAAMLDQHVWTTFHLAKACIPEMRKNGWGRVIVISSPVVGNPPANNLPYTVAKSGEEAIVLTLAEELKHSGVTANILRVRTIDVQHQRIRAPSDKNASWTTPEEITAAIDYLCSEEGGAVNGARLSLYRSP